MTRNKNEIIKAVEDFYRDLYNSGEQPRTKVNEVIREIPDITTEGIERTLKGIKEKETPEDGISLDLLREAEENAAVKLANLFKEISYQRQISETLEKCNDYFDTEERG